MSGDIARDLRQIADASKRADGSDIPLGQQLRTAADALDAKDKRIAELQAGGWQPIETAPTNVDILVAGPLDGRWSFSVYRIRDKYWREDWDAEPTHWQPLPAPPSSPKAEANE